jgi:endonuclease VIII
VAEGPAVVRWSLALRPLIGEPLLAVGAPRRWHDRAAAILGATVTDVETRGKHLLLHLSNGGAIHGHAMQYGSWQVGEPGMSLRKVERYIRLRLRTARHEAVYYHGPVMEILTADELATHGALLALGPDLMRHDFDPGEAARRIASAGNRPIGDAVLDQRLVAGIGNIFKSEGLFLARIDPRRPARTVSRRALGSLWAELIPLMHASADHIGPTTTLPPDLLSPTERHWVYRRRGHPCRRCGTPIAMERQGELRRATYYCPRCQRPAPSGAASPPAAWKP